MIRPSALDSFPRTTLAREHRLCTLNLSFVSLCDNHSCIPIDTREVLAYAQAMGVSPRDFERMKSRVVKGASGPDATLSADDAAPNLNGEVILGIDPSLRGTGYGLIRVDTPQSDCLAHGTIKCPPKWEHSRCLGTIAGTIRQLIEQHQPTICVFEGLFHAQNMKTALIMGQARGAAMASVGEAGLPIYEMAARKVKQSIVGFGGAQKLAVARMVQRMLSLKDLPDPDAADALALALAHAQTYSRSVLSAAVRL